MSLEKRRLWLEKVLEDVLGTRNVYFQPPSSIQMSYPCIVYSYEDLVSIHANNAGYIDRDRYTVTLITKDPMPEETLEKLNNIPYTSFDRHYASENLHHFAFTTHLFERTQNG